VLADAAAIEGQRPAGTAQAKGDSAYRAGVGAGVGGIRRGGYRLNERGAAVDFTRLNRLEGKTCRPQEAV